MAHNLMNDGSGEAMFFVGKVPWHELGTQLETEATSEQAIKAARLNWEVVKTPLYFRSGVENVEVPEHCAVVRKDLLGRDNCPLIGVVAPDYEPFQNHEAFKFMDSLVGDMKAVYHTAGALGNGERVWILAKLPEPWAIGGDRVEPYLLLVTGHDGRTAVQVLPTSVRVVCQNTVNQALARASRIARAAHTRDLHFQLDAIAEDIKETRQGFEQMRRVFAGMVQKKMQDAEVDRYLMQVFPDPEVKTHTRIADTARRDRERAKMFFHEGHGNSTEQVRGTLWAAFNGVTQYADHHRTNVLGQRRLFRVLFGPEFQIKKRAMDVATVIVNSN
jgi:phage/plasmid-like protein (TIGR03299 family)